MLHNGPPNYRRECFGVALCIAIGITNLAADGHSDEIATALPDDILSSPQDFWCANEAGRSCLSWIDTLAPGDPDLDRIIEIALQYQKANTYPGSPWFDVLDTVFRRNIMNAEQLERFLRNSIDTTVVARPRYRAGAPLDMGSQLGPNWSEGGDRNNFLCRGVLIGCSLDGVQATTPSLDEGGLDTFQKLTRCTWKFESPLRTDKIGSHTINVVWAVDVQLPLDPPEPPYRLQYEMLAHTTVIPEDQDLVDLISDPESVHEVYEHVRLHSCRVEGGADEMAVVVEVRASGLEHWFAFNVFIVTSGFDGDSEEAQIGRGSFFPPTPARTFSSWRCRIALPVTVNRVTLKLRPNTSIVESLFLPTTEVVAAEVLFRDIPIAGRPNAN